MPDRTENPLKERTRVLLVIPDFNEYQVYLPFLTVLEPIALEILGAAIQDLAEVEIFDRRLEGEAAYRERLARFNPQIVGVTTHSAGEANTSKRILSLAKRHNKLTWTIVGGVHPTLSPADYLHPDVDLACVGYGEQTLREVVQACSEGRSCQTIPGLALNGALCGSPGRQVLTPRRVLVGRALRLPSPDRGLVKKYLKHYWHSVVLSSRGCPYRCNFCALWKAAEGRYMVRSPEEIVDDIAQAPRKMVLLADDNTFHDIARAERICELIEKRGIRKNYTCYARTDTIVKHPELFRRWYAAGLRWLVIGFEALTDADLKALNKSNNLENNAKAIRFLQDLGITNLAHFIIRPDFSVQDFEDLWHFIDENKISSPYLPLLTPIPGTELYFEEQAKGTIEDQAFEFYNFEYMVLKTKLPKEEFYRQVLRLWRRSTSPARLLSLGFKRDLPLPLYLARWYILRKSLRQLENFYKLHAERCARGAAQLLEAPAAPKIPAETFASPLPPSPVAAPH